MESSSVKERLITFFKKITQNKPRIILWTIGIILTVILSFKIHWNQPPQKTIIRTQLP